MSTTREAETKAKAEGARSGAAANTGHNNGTEQTAELSFLELLNNRAKHATISDAVHRTRGFLCLVRGPSGNRVSLQKLQMLCHSDKQEWNFCLTLRYRVESRNGLGTFFHALVHDLRLVLEESSDWSLLFAAPQPTTREALVSEAASISWETIVERAQNLGSMSRLPPLEGPSGEPLNSLDEEWLTDLLAFFGEEELVGSGNRLVLFCEFAGDDPPEIWDRVLPFILERLPERVGLVVSGAPAEFTPPADTVHYREITLTDDGGAEISGERAQHFQIAGLSSDRPATEDGLGVTRYAEALAQFILHPDTDPLTIGIHGPWGKGKSSFMGFIERHLLLEASRRSENSGLGTFRQAEEAWRSARENLERTQDEGRRGASLRPGALEKLGAETARRKQSRDARWAALTKEADRDVICVPFNAWRFQDSRQIWAGLASVIIGRLEASLTNLQRLRLQVGYAWRARRADVLRTMVELTLALLVAVLLTYWFGLTEGQPVANGQPAVDGQVAVKDQAAATETLTGKDPVSLLLRVFGGPISFLLLAFWRIHGVIRPMGERVLEYARLPNYREQMGFQHQVLNDIRSVATAVRRSKRAEPRIVIFIDDLDRCSDDKIMEILQAINLVLGESNFYVVLGVDTEMLYRAIEAHYEKAHTRERAARPLLGAIYAKSFNFPSIYPTQDRSSDSISSATCSRLAPASRTGRTVVRGDRTIGPMRR